MDLKALKSQWDRVLALVLAIAGVVALIVGIVEVNDSVLLAEQTRYIVGGGILGLFLLGAAATLWISADLRDEWRKLDRIERALADGVLRWSGDDAPGAGSQDALQVDDGAQDDGADDDAPADATAAHEHA